MPMVMTAMMVPVGVVVPRSAHIGRTQVDVDNACDGAEAGLALQAQRLQRDRIVGAADQQVGADADTRRGVGAHTAEMTGKRTAANPMARRVHDPRETGFRGCAQIETEALDVRDFTAMTARLAEADAATPIDLAIFNAGLGGSVSDEAITESPGAAQATAEVNFVSPVMGAHLIATAMAKRGRCCGCFPNVVETIIRVTEEYHARSEAGVVDIVSHLERVRELRVQYGSRTHERRQTGHRAA